ncbi:SPP41 family protein ASCRUDRAFT_67908 [Ascoidea rubescens DSM 1968]|uniref:DUF3020 domain-containing protein n=1 Tax=Ascoidea rubescens DSM 1968 TaxID=1344418 RepID=A0A1D2VQF4_9ASCO|nr:hypothetical protein ASCRUDRAFT_67908 [Ascoidea rubescens DSM 1968]ODV63846.1 hypothetical protein ASCRUDRAFT_67908 [Ascoidea rubescens DSM 1968]
MSHQDSNSPFHIDEHELGFQENALADTIAESFMDLFDQNLTNEDDQHTDNYNIDNHKNNENSHSNGSSDHLNENHNYVDDNFNDNNSSDQISNTNIELDSSLKSRKVPSFHDNLTIDHLGVSSKINNDLGNLFDDVINSALGSINIDSNENEMNQITESDGNNKINESNESDNSNFHITDTPNENENETKNIDNSIETPSQISSEINIMHPITDSPLTNNKIIQNDSDNDNEKIIDNSQPKTNEKSLNQLNTDNDNHNNDSLPKDNLNNSSLIPNFDLNRAISDALLDLSENMANQIESNEEESQIDKRNDNQIDTTNNDNHTTNSNNETKNSSINPQSSQVISSNPLEDVISNALKEISLNLNSQNDQNYSNTQNNNQSVNNKLLLTQEFPENDALASVINDVFKDISTSNYQEPILDNTVISNSKHKIFQDPLTTAIADALKDITINADDTITATTTSGDALSLAIADAFQDLSGTSKITTIKKSKKHPENKNNKQAQKPKRKYTYKRKTSAKSRQYINNSLLQNAIAEAFDDVSLHMIDNQENLITQNEQSELDKVISQALEDVIDISSTQVSLSNTNKKLDKNKNYNLDSLNSQSLSGKNAMAGKKTYNLASELLAHFDIDKAIENALKSIKNKNDGSLKNDHLNNKEVSKKNQPIPSTNPIESILNNTGLMNSIFQDAIEMASDMGSNKLSSSLLSNSQDISKINDNNLNVNNINITNNSNNNFSNHNNNNNGNNINNSDLSSKKKLALSIAETLALNRSSMKTPNTRDYSTIESIEDIKRTEQASSQPNSMKQQPKKRVGKESSVSPTLPTNSPDITSDSPNSKKPEFPTSNSKSLVTLGDSSLTREAIEKAFQMIIEKRMPDKERIRFDNRERKKRWREINADRNKDNDLRCRVHKKADSLFGKEDSVKKQEWVIEEFNRRKAKRLERKETPKPKSSLPSTGLIFNNSTNSSIIDIDPLLNELAISTNGSNKAESLTSILSEFISKIVNQQSQESPSSNASEFVLGVPPNSISSFKVKSLTPNINNLVKVSPPSNEPDLELSSLVQGVDPKELKETSSFLPSKDNDKITPDPFVPSNLAARIANISLSSMIPAKRKAQAENTNNKRQSISSHVDNEPLVENSKSNGGSVTDEIDRKEKEAEKVIEKEPTMENILSWASKSSFKLPSYKKKQPSISKIGISFSGISNRPSLPFQRPTVSKNSESGVRRRIGFPSSLLGLNRAPAI